MGESMITHAEGANVMIVKSCTAPKSVAMDLSIGNTFAKEERSR